MKARELMKLGVPKGAPVKLAVAAIKSAHKAKSNKAEIRATLHALLADPAAYLQDEHFGEFAQMMRSIKSGQSDIPLNDPVPYRKWGADFNSGTIRQMDNACRLPVAVKGALMPDAHQGYGLPIGGVLAVKNSVIPYAVGKDIACRMKLSVLDLPPAMLAEDTDRLIAAIERETRFGVGSAFRDRKEHAVMDADWSFAHFVHSQKDRAWGQLGSSGGGNHFVEFGILTLERDALGLKAGVYAALLSHSGSRGTGALIADHYSRLARSLHPELPREQAYLSWLDLQSEPGQEYWLAMELMGRYASANHELIHRAVLEHLGLEALATVENHHNFAWRETFDNQELIIHRKGATPADTGALAVIPGSMAAPAFVVRGLGNVEALNSASHGAGRAMSRKKAKESFTWRDAEKYIKERRVKIISAGLDEVPMAYKDINVVMAAQNDLVEILARFDPKVVKMAGENKRKRR